MRSDGIFFLPFIPGGEGRNNSCFIPTKNNRKRSLVTGRKERDSPGIVMQTNTQQKWLIPVRKRHLSCSCFTLRPYQVNPFPFQPSSAQKSRDLSPPPLRAPGLGSYRSTDHWEGEDLLENKGREKREKVAPRSHPPLLTAEDDSSGLIFTNRKSPKMALHHLLDPMYMSA